MSDGDLPEHVTHREGIGYRCERCGNDHFEAEDAVLCCPGDSTEATSGDRIEIDVENIPAELRERDQWAMWDASNDTPRQPHWRGDFGKRGDPDRFSWSDPDHWHSFEEAVEAASERDSWGIGYVFAASNDDHPRGLYGVLDLDGCVGEDGRPKEWLPALQPFFDADAYMEYSPSGEGIHVPLAGLEQPGWWSDSHFTADEHEGVEVLTSKFCTFTGDQVRNSGDDVADTGEFVDEWLTQAHKAVNGDDPHETPNAELSSGGDDGDYTGDGLTPDQAAAALDHIDPNVAYPVWRDIGFALADEYADSRALSLFTDWSRGGSSWDDDAPKLAERIIEDSSPGGGRTMGTVARLAKQNGWSHPGGGGSSAGEPQGKSGETASADGGTAVESADGGAAVPSGSADTDRDELTPMAVMARAGLGEDDDISDLDDRQKAACVWDLVERSDDVHVRVRRDNGSLWSYDGGIWKPEGERALRHAARKALTSMNYGSNVLAELKAQARGDPRAEVEPDEFGLETGHLAVQNGLVDLDLAADALRCGDDDLATVALRDLRPDDLALTRLSAEFDPEAGFDEWAGYVDEWAEDGKADALAEYAGYCLHIGGLPIHRAMLLVGNGANGKGTFLHVVRTLLGKDNTTSIELQTLANEKDAVADFYGALANIDDDLSARKLGAGLGMFKKLVGGDRVRARRLYQDGFEFDAVGKHLYAANEVPQVDVPDEDEAFWRRWLLVEFPNFYPPNERDETLRDQLTEPDALAGVLNWAILGRARLLDQGYFTGEERLAHEKRRRWQSWGDAVDEFISEHVERDPDADRMTTGEAYQRFEAWCRVEEKDHDGGQQGFTGKLKTEDVGYGQHRIDGTVTRGYKALGLSDDVPEADDDDPDDSTQERL